MPGHMILLAAGAALLNPLPNDEGDLLQVSSSREPAIWYVDRKSVVHSGRLRTARIVVTHMEGLRVRHVQDFEVSVDCSRRRVTPLSVSQYLYGDIPAARRVLDENDDGFIAQPRTYAASAVTYLCGNNERRSFSIDPRRLRVSN